MHKYFVINEKKKKERQLYYLGMHKKRIWMSSNQWSQLPNALNLENIKLAFLIMIREWIRLVFFLFCMAIMMVTFSINN